MNPVAPCAVCGQPVEMGLGQARFSNGVGSSVIVIEHPNQSICPTCGAVLYLVIGGIQNFQIKTAKVPPSQQPLIVPARVVG